MSIYDNKISSHKNSKEANYFKKDINHNLTSKCFRHCTKFKINVKESNHTKTVSITSNLNYSNI